MELREDGDSKKDIPLTTEAIDAEYVRLEADEEKSRKKIQVFVNKKMLNARMHAIKLDFDKAISNFKEAVELYKTEKNISDFVTFLKGLLDSELMSTKQANLANDLIKKYKDKK